MLKKKESNFKNKRLKSGKESRQTNKNKLKTLFKEIKKLKNTMRLKSTNLIKKYKKKIKIHPIILLMMSSKSKSAPKKLLLQKLNNKMNTKNQKLID